MTPWVRFFYMIALLMMIAAATARQAGDVMLIAFTIAGLAFLMDALSYYVKGEGRE